MKPEMMKYIERDSELERARKSKPVCPHGQRPNLCELCVQTDLNSYQNKVVTLFSYEDAED